MRREDRRLAGEFILFLVCLILAFGYFGPCARHAHPDPLPVTRALWVPPDYDDFGEPMYARADTFALPRLWVWPEGGVHQFNLVGVYYQVWSPPLATYAMRAILRCTVNYWGAFFTESPQPGDALTYSGFQDPRRSFFKAFTADSAVVIRRGGAVVESVSDTVIMVRSWIIVGSPLWAADDSLWNRERLVPQGWARAVGN